MSDSKVFMFPDGGNTGGTDAATLMALMNNGGFGNGNWIWVLFMFMLFGWRGNGGWGSDNGGAERDLLMQAINGNRSAIGELSTRLNCDINSITAAINAVQSSVQSVGAQVGLTGQQTINAIQQGNMGLAQQIAQCCCDNKLLACQNHSATISRIDQLSNVITQGFSSTAYETAQQTCAIQNSLRDQTQTVLDKLSAMQADAQQDKINNLTAQLTAANSRAERAAELKPIYDQLALIKAGQPSTATVQYPNLVAVPAAQMYGQIYGGCGCQGGNGFWY